MVTIFLVFLLYGIKSFLPRKATFYNTDTRILPPEATVRSRKRVCVGSQRSANSLGGHTRLAGGRMPR
ncbi:hypothetical protein C241_15228 [Bradyrhizobium lupini HPC(L)]|uniref:Uncharacterized protein n=1 Tax=Bradyrhizobium lupini HPC(L) TaxID=1229491 RepID=A0ABN0HKE5_RHILU|nr:hypothetical protein C241_15228 [Bradyrhizobium lupini HPC(L)]